MQIHSFDTVVSEKEAVILEVSAFFGFIIHFTVTIKAIISSSDHSLRKIPWVSSSFPFFCKTQTGLVFSAYFYRKADR